jgi:LMBR1 domain-containing protein 1
MQKCNQTENGVRDCSNDKDLIVPCDVYGPTGTVNKQILKTKTLKHMYQHVHFINKQYINIYTYIYTQITA